MWRTWGRYVATFVVIGLVLWFPFGRGARVPLLWAADLGFHELGHLLTMPFGQTVHFVAGSAAQVLVPLGLATYFWVRQRHHAATGLMLAWAAAAAYDASVYIADAPYQRLPLIGGHHDWAFLLGRWNALDRAEAVAGTVRLLGLLTGILGAVVCSVPLYDVARRRVRIRNGRTPRDALPIREIRWRGDR